MKLHYRELHRTKSLLWIWGAAILAAALLYALSGFYRPLDALFESVSGFTATGATTAADLSALPAWLLVFRAGTQWLGSLLTIVTIFPLLPFYEVPTRIRTRSYVLVYLALSAAEFLLLLVGGNGFFDSLTLMCGSKVKKLTSPSFVLFPFSI